MALRGGENLFSREKIFSPPRTPPLSKKARYFCSRCSQSIFYKFIISLLAKRALHVCRTANASLCASNASRRIYPALHGLPTANHTSPTPFEKSEVFCRSACPAIARRATADCRGIVYSNSNAQLLEKYYLSSMGTERKKKTQISAN